METNVTPENHPSNNNEPARPRDAQDRAIANGISTALNVLTVLQEDDDVINPMERRGYDEPEINVGVSFQIAAQTTYNQRQRTMGDLEEAADHLKKLVATARKDYSDFRRVARARFKTQADRTKLAIGGRIPRDLQQFLTVATTSYTEAGKAPFLAVLTKKGNGAAVLTDLLAGLKAVDTAMKDQKAKAATAQKATKTRDTAYGLLKEWMGELRETAKVAFRDAPEQARKLDF